jgi:hypothetical protein
MSEHARIGKRLGHAVEVDLAHWIDVDHDALPEKRRAQFLTRRKAIEMYLAGASETELQESTGLPRSNVYRIIVDRCLAQHSDGTLMGWRGALPFFRVADYQRKTAPTVRTHSGGGTAGALQWLFDSPGGADIEAKFRKQIVGKVPQLASAKRPKLELFSWFIKELRAAGLEARGEWPFNVDKLGYVSICKFIDKVMDENPRRQRQLLGGKDAERKARAGDGADRPDLRVFQRVECDAHKLDTRMVVLIPSPHGGYETRTIRRVWVIVVIEVASRAVLGYHLSLP